MIFNKSFVITENMLTFAVQSASGQLYCGPFVYRLGREIFIL